MNIDRDEVSSEPTRASLSRATSMHGTPPSLCSPHNIAHITSSPPTSYPHPPLPPPTGSSAKR
jgi:hypothetical protein